MSYIIMDNEDGLVAYIDFESGKAIIGNGYNIEEIADEQGETVEMPTINNVGMDEYER